MKKYIFTITINLAVLHSIMSQTQPAGTTSIKPYLLTNKISIGTNQIANKLYIVDNTPGGGAVDERFFIRLYNADISASSGVTQEMLSGNSGAKMEIGQFGATYGIGSSLNAIYGNRGTIIARGGSGLIIRSSPDENGSYVYDGITFQTGANTPERMRITGTGLVGIGTTNPKTKLQVTDGDVYVDNASKGIILKSPNGGCWRVTIDDSGNFVRTAISCP